MEDLGIGWVHSFSDSWLLRGLHFAKLPPGSMKVFAGHGMGGSRDSPSFRSFLVLDEIVIMYYNIYNIIILYIYNIYVYIICPYKERFERMSFLYVRIVLSCSVMLRLRDLTFL